MISDLAYTSKDLYTFNHVKSKLIYLLALGITSLYTRSLYYLVNILTSTGFIYWDCDTDKANIYTKEKFELLLASFSSLLLSGIFESSILYNLISGQSARQLII